MLISWEGRKPCLRMFPSIFQGDAPKWKKAFLRLYRECWGGSAEKEHRMQNRTGFIAMLAKPTMGA